LANELTPVYLQNHMKNTNSLSMYHTEAGRTYTYNGQHLWDI